jgi:hypothetical protein
MKLIGPALGNDVQHRVAAPILGVEALCEQVIFLDGLERNRLREAADGVVVVVAAVDEGVESAAVVAVQLRGRLQRCAKCPNGNPRPTPGWRRPIP